MNIHFPEKFLFKILFLIIFTLFPISSLANQPLRADKIVVIKSEIILFLIKNGGLFRGYYISLGKNPVGHKKQIGDGRTPEGNYIITYKNPNSCSYLSLQINYPSPADRESARRRGVHPGGNIFIHGRPNGFGWDESYFKENFNTDGCIGVSNAAIEEIWQFVGIGTPIEILP